VPAHAGVVEKKKAPLSGGNAGRGIQGGFNIIAPELGDQKIKG
jgi:hypothetical protein